MKAIHADPKEIRKIFTEEYMIPDFQRPYSWEIEHCDKLWDDIVTFHERKSGQDDRYFLGNIVIHKDGTRFSVVDGQQRLTTIMLMLKAFFSHAGTFTVLEKCIKAEDSKTGELTEKLRVESFVIDNDRANLSDIIFNDGQNLPDTSSFKINYTYLRDMIQAWKQKNTGADQLDGLIKTFLDQVVLLPIHCGSEDDALTIFETINNRGLSLTDADLFKAKLHGKAGAEKNDFLKMWNDLQDHEWYFRILMHVERARADIHDKEIALRTFFTTQNRLNDWKTIMCRLDLFHNFENDWDGTPEINSLWHIMMTFPNYYWNFPAFVFLEKFGSVVDDEFSLPEEKIPEFVILLRETTRFFFIKGVVFNTVNAVKDTVFNVCAAIAQDRDYLTEYRKSTADNIEEMHNRLASGNHGRYLRGLVLLAAYLNPEQDPASFAGLVMGKYDIEHILPKKWNDYDKWTEASWRKSLNSLGNLVPLEKELNIRASNEFFTRKKEYYKKTCIRDAQDLTVSAHWYPEDFKSRDEKQKKLLINFFE